jgi:hypothetical protein
MTSSRGATRRAVLLSSALVLGLLTVPATYAAGAAEPTATAPTSPVDAVQVVEVDTPTRGDKDRLVSLGLDLTEHAGEDYVEVVLHGAADAELLREAGFSYEVEVPDLLAQNKANRELDAQYAASVAASPLPSGRTSYRTLAQYNSDMAELVKANPGLVKALTLPEKTIEGRDVNGIEITRDVEAKDGKPVFLLMGLHHAREWPSGEHALEFAFDLVNNVKAGDARTVELLSRARVIVVPVVNPDGFNASITSGAVDGRAVDDGGTVAILGTPGNAYRRKNCRPLPVTPSGQACVAQPGQGGFGTGVDLNRNYGGLWGGAGASATPEDPTYRGAAPFSEPESRNVRALVASRQVTTLITNHTFSNLVLRPPGVRAQGPPPDETVYEALGARMTAQNGYVNQPSYDLYDTTGTTEDWTYYATGGLGFTFEIGEEFHPPFERVVEHYVGGTQGEDRGAGPFVDKGNREAYYQALTSTADSALHSVLKGKAPAGAVLKLEKEFVTQTSEVLSPTGAKGPRQDFKDVLSSSMTVGPNGSFDWHTNPSTRPAVMEKRMEELGDPLRTRSSTGADPARRRLDRPPGHHHRADGPPDEGRPHLAHPGRHGPRGVPEGGRQAHPRRLLGQLRHREGADLRRGRHARRVRPAPDQLRVHLAELHPDRGDLRRARHRRDAGPGRVLHPRLHRRRGREAPPAGRRQPRPAGRGGRLRAQRPGRPRADPARHRPGLPSGPRAAEEPRRHRRQHARALDRLHGLVRDRAGLRQPALRPVRAGHPRADGQLRGPAGRAQRREPPEQRPGRLHRRQRLDARGEHQQARRGRHRAGHRRRWLLAAGRRHARPDGDLPGQRLPVPQRADHHRPR